MAVIILTVLAGMGVALLFITQSDLRMNRALTHTKRAFYMAEAGVENGRRTLFDTNGEGSFDDDLLGAAGGNALLDVDVASLRPVYDADGNVVGIDGAGDDVPLVALTALDDGYYATFLMNDPLEVPLGRAELVDTNDRLVLASIGIDRRGQAFEVVEAIIEPDPQLPRPPSAAISLLGPSPTFEGGSSNVSEYSGVDCVAGNYVPAVGVFGAAAETLAEDGIFEPNGPDYESDPALTDAEDTISDLDDLTDPLVNETVEPIWTDCDDLHDLVESLRERADYYCRGNACELPPGTTMDSLVFIDGDFSLDSADGLGVLIVTGELSIRGTRSWTGVVLAVGEGRINRYGGGNGIVTGTIMAADIAGPDDQFWTADDCTGGTGGFGSVTYEVSGAGTSRTRFCTDDIAATLGVHNYRVAEFQQH